MDASLMGWGAHIDDHTTFGQWTLAQASSHINMLEMEAVFLSLMEFLPFFRVEHVLIQSDNTTVVSYLNKQGRSRSLSLSHRACEIQMWCYHHEILLSAKYLSRNLNGLADSLSRSAKIVHTEWTLSHHALLRLRAHVEKPLIDLFATWYYRLLPMFVSPFPDPKAWKMNALEIILSGLTVAP
ncbi:hypothetical protein V1264_001084 [Littorina saxatilis]|uniref:RNase H type-1 domain-containing protein n=1 Tax=Littorina saxatilis TaxID=31220 RepID=A0AAN9GPB2_9CAEN